MATNAVIQTVGAAGYVSLRVTQASHGLTGRVPVYYNTSTNLWTAAQANAGTTLGTHLAKVIDSNTLLIVQSGIFPDTSHGLTAGQYYFVSDSAAGTLTTTEPTAVGSFSNPMIYVTDANTYIVLGYRSSQTVNQSFNPLLNDGTAAAPSLAFSADTDTGIYRVGANDIGIAVNGAKAFEADPSNVGIYTGGVERFRVASTGQQSSTVPDLSGSNTTLYPEYKCRVWANFDGSTSAIRASGNVSSITKGGTGNYTINFTTALPDANYSITASDNSYGSNWNDTVVSGSFRNITYNPSTFATYDTNLVYIAVFR